MGIALWDAKVGNAEPFYLQSRVWRAIVEAIRRLEVLPEDRTNLLHDVWNPKAMLTALEARNVALAIESELLPNWLENEIIAWDGRKTFVDDAQIDWDEWHRNWSVSRGSMVSFCNYCKGCEGFFVRQ